MKKLVQPVLLLVVILQGGCATHSHGPPPSRNERVRVAIATLYDETRTRTGQDGDQRYALISDTEVVNAAEALLLHYSRSDDPDVRGVAASRLVYFGTKAALTRALELARSEESPEARAMIWCNIAELLWNTAPPSVQPFELIAGSSATPGESNLVQVLSNPVLTVVSRCGGPAVDLILPEDVTREQLEAAIIAHYARDDGQWTVDVVDKMPYIPFTGRRYTVTCGVRNAIASKLEWSARGNQRMLTAFKEFSQSLDPAIREPAKALVSALSEVHRNNSSDEDR